MGQMFEIVFFVFFCMVLLTIVGTFVFIFISTGSRWNKNRHSPRLTVPCTVVSKRMSVNRTGTGVNTMNASSYYATFQVESGDRMELFVPGSEFGLLVEGDRGNLTFQGTRFLSFQRT